MKSQPVASAAGAPLCVELERTLTPANLLAEAMIAAVRRRPALAAAIPFWALRGRAYLWKRVAEGRAFDPSTLPYSAQALRTLRAEASVRPVVLVSRSHPLVAETVAAHLGFFSHSYCSYSGTAPDEAWLEAEFGSSRCDRFSGDAAPRRSALTVALRPKHWVKNLLVFAAAFLGHRLGDPHALRQSALVFLIFCAASSAAYLFNDIADLEADRRHPLKRQRPFARGGASVSSGIVVASALGIGAFAFGCLMGQTVGSLIALYLAATFVYSVWIKELLILDLILLTSFYLIRVFAGGAATGIPISFWTLLFSLLLFTGLASVKRFSELHNRSAQAEPSANRRAYQAEDAVPLLAIATACLLGALIALGLYLGSPEVRILYRQPEILWFAFPVLLGWISRILILANRGVLANEDPVAFALTDRWTHGAAVLVLILYYSAV